jgi:hypothetical protein
LGGTSGATTKPLLMTKLPLYQDRRLLPLSSTELTKEATFNKRQQWQHKHRVSYAKQAALLEGGHEVLYGTDFTKDLESDRSARRHGREIDKILQGWEKGKYMITC